MADKKFTPREAAVAVLQKTEELYKSSALAKGDWAKIHSKLKREGYSEESADKIDGAIKAKMGKSEEPIEKNVLDANARKHIKPKNFAGPDKSYPIENAAHARDALSRVSANGSPEEKAEVRRKVHAKYPGIGKTEENPDAAADADLGEKVEQDVAQHEASNKDPEHHEKGSYKLAKFMGKMEMKKGMREQEMGGEAISPMPTPPAQPAAPPVSKSSK